MSKECRDCKAEKPANEFYSSKNGKFGLAAYCKICDNIRRKARNDADPQKNRDRAAAWSKANPERKKHADFRYHQEHKIEQNAKNIARYYRNKEKISAALKQKRIDEAEKISADRARRRRANVERYREYRQKDYRKNKTAYVANARKRDIQKLKAVPPWADLERIKEIYAERDRLSKSTGIVYHVDHIVPLQSPKVCGLHVHYNLRVIPAQENIRKSNRLLEESM